MNRGVAQTFQTSELAVKSTALLIKAPKPSRWRGQRGLDFAKPLRQEVIGIG